MLSMTQKTPSPELSKEVGTLCFGAVSAKGAGWLQHIERPMDVKSQTRTQRMSLKSFCKEEWAKTNYKKRFAAVLLPTKVIRPSTTSCFACGSNIYLTQ